MNIFGVLFVLALIASLSLIIAALFGCAALYLTRGAQRGREVVIAASLLGLALVPWIVAVTLTYSILRFQEPFFGLKFVTGLVLLVPPISGLVMVSRWLKRVRKMRTPAA